MACWGMTVHVDECGGMGPPMGDCGCCGCRWALVVMVTWFGTWVTVTDVGDAIVCCELTTTCCGCWFCCCCCCWTFIGELTAGGGAGGGIAVCVETMLGAAGPPSPHKFIIFIKSGCWLIILLAVSSEVFPFFVSLTLFSYFLIFFFSMRHTLSRCTGVVEWRAVLGRALRRYSWCTVGGMSHGRQRRMLQRCLRSSAGREHGTLPLRCDYPGKESDALACTVIPPR